MKTDTNYSKANVSDVASYEEFLLASIRVAVCEARLAVADLEAIGIAVKNHAIAPDVALKEITNLGLSCLLPKHHTMFNPAGRCT